MAKSIEPKLRKIGDYLKLEKDTVFTIPEYQRAYSWGTEHCDQLWQDIDAFVDSGSTDRYFFGTIIINCQDDDKKLALIDGQQRTTTFLLLLKALLVRINEEILRTTDDPDSASLLRGLQERRRRIMGILYKAEAEYITDKPDNRDAEVCNNVYILENMSINELYKDELTNILKAVNYTEAEATVKKIPYKHNDNKYTNFFRNYKYFYGKVCDLGTSQLNNVAKTVTDNCEVIEIKSWQVEQAITMFNSLNADGLPLYDSDIISAKLYAEAEKDMRKTEFAGRWQQLREQVNNLKSVGIADINSVLMQYMYYIRTITGATQRDTGSVNVTTPGLRRYFTELNKDAIRKPFEMCNALLNLVKIWEKISNYTITKVMLKFNENAKLFLASYFYRYTADEIGEEAIQIVVESMLRLFVLLEIGDYGYSSKYFKTFLFGEEIKLANSGISEEEIRKDFNIHIHSNWDRIKVKETLKEYNCRNSNGLVFLNEYLYAKSKNLPFVLDYKCDVEHIMPSSGINLESIRKDADIVTKEEFDEIVNRLGNKILLEEKINRAIGSEWFKTKVSATIKEKTGYKDSQYPIAAALVAKYQDRDKIFWTKDDILDATEKASERITKFIFDE